MSRSSVNCNVMTEAFWLLVDVICASPGSWPNCFSSGAVTLEATTSGSPPGRNDWTWIVG